MFEISPKNIIAWKIIVYFQLIIGAWARLANNKEVTFISKKKLNLALIMTFSIWRKIFVFLALVTRTSALYVTKHNKGPSTVDISFLFSFLFSFTAFNNFTFYVRFFPLVLFPSECNEFPFLCKFLLQNQFRTERFSSKYNASMWRLQVSTSRKFHCYFIFFFRRWAREDRYNGSFFYYRQLSLLKVWVYKKSS